MTSQDVFSTETAGLAAVSRPGVVRLRDGDLLELGIGAVRNNIEGAELRMLAYNGSIPGPTLHVDQRSEITVQVRNEGDVETTVHWHGLRLENRYDGVPHETQEPIQIGGSFTYKLQFPDAGLYWYHPHMREDFAQEMGLYGTIIVEPSDPSYWPAVDRHLTLTLDDLLVEDGHIAPFNRSGPTFTAGRGKRPRRKGTASAAAGGSRRRNGLESADGLSAGSRDAPRHRGRRGGVVRCPRHRPAGAAPRRR
jgi:FtsP/CotA-like multicopper oxidase with cupredoxin domain